MLSKKFLSVVLALSSLNAFAITEQEVVKLALERNEISAMTQNQIAQAELRIKQARSYLYPTLTANASWLKNYILPEKRLPGGIEMRTGEISLSQPIYTFGRLSSGIEIAKLDNEIAKNNASGSIAEIVMTAKQLYYNAAFSKSVYSIAQDSIKNANHNKNALEDRVSSGRINQNDNLKMQADIASRHPQMLEAKKGYEAALQELSSFLDVPLEQINGIDATPGAYVSQSLQEKPIDHFVDVTNAAKQTKLKAAQEQLAKNDYMPTLSAFASYKPSHTPNGGNIPGLLMVDTAAFGLRLDFELPLGGAKTYERKVKTLDRENAELDMKRVRRTVSMQQNSFIQQYNTLKEKQKVIDNAIKLAESSYKVALRSFRNGSVSQLQLNDSELLLTNNKIAREQNILQMKVLNSQLERLQTEGGAK